MNSNDIQFRAQNKIKAGEKTIRTTRGTRDVTKSLFEKAVCRWRWGAM